MRLRGRNVVHASAGAVALAVALAGCGLGDREAYADAIADGVDAAIESGSATGSLQATLRVVEVPPIAGVAGVDLAEGFPDPTSMPPTEPIAADVAIDFDERRAALEAEAVHEVFDGLHLYGVRHAASERDARPWVLLDLEDLDEGATGLDGEQDPPLLAMNAISPVVLVDLASGALTGSIERIGSDTVAGVATTRYEANFDVEKVLRKTRRDAYDEERREAVERLLDALNVKGGVHRGEVWIDGDGLLRRFDLALRIEPRRKLVFEVGLRLELDAFGAAVAIEPPGAAALLEIDSLVGFLRSVVPQPDDGFALAPEVES